MSCVIPPKPRLNTLDERLQTSESITKRPSTEPTMPRRNNNYPNALSDFETAFANADDALTAAADATQTDADNGQWWSTHNHRHRYTASAAFSSNSVTLHVLLHSVINSASSVKSALPFIGVSRQEAEALEDYDGHINAIDDEWYGGDESDDAEEDCTVRSCWWRFCWRWQHYWLSAIGITYTTINPYTVHGTMEFIFISNDCTYYLRVKVT